MTTHLLPRPQINPVVAGLTVCAAGQARRVRFVMHPSHLAVARSIDALDGGDRAAPKTGLIANTTTGPSSPAQRPITRLDVLSTMEAALVGLTASQIAEKVVGSVDEGATHRVCAVLARETARGLVNPVQGHGRGAARTLSPAGREMVAKLRQQNAERQDLRRAQDMHLRRQRKRAINQQVDHSHRVNGVFDYARKVHLGLLNPTAQ